MNRSPNIFSRNEVRYELQKPIAGYFQTVVSRHLPLYEYRKGRPSTYITTVYFDTDRLDLFKRAKSCYEDNVRFRVKEYCYELEDKRLEYYLTCFVEIKRQTRGLVLKRRIRIPKKLLNALIQGEDIWERLVEADPELAVGNSSEIYQELRRFLESHVVRPRATVNYRRHVFQKDEAKLRLTFDDQLTIFPPLEGLYDKVQCLNYLHLKEPLPAHEINKVIMEIKCQGEYPPWLGRLLKDYLPLRTSKFTRSIDLIAGEAI